jgi:3-oxoadipate enol-lactonase
MQAMDQVTSGDAQIAYQVLGDGPPVVLLHPFPAHHEFWLPAAEFLSRYRLILPDLRGHGDSGIGEGPATMDKHAVDVTRVCEAAGVGSAIFVGVSIGGYILLEFWRRYRQRVSALVLCDTRAQADNPEGRANRLEAAEDVLKHGTQPFIDRMLPKLLGKTTHHTRPDLVENARKMMLKMSAEDISQVQRGMAVRPDSVATSKTIDVPTLVLVGEEDILTPIAEAELMHKQIARSELRVLPRAGHYAAYEQAQAVGALLRQFVDSVPRH